LTAVTILGGGSGGGGGGTYLLAVVQELARGGDRGIRWTVTAQPPLAALLEQRANAGVRVLRQPVASPARRLVSEQLGACDGSAAQVLVAAGNFVPLLRRGPSVLLAQNALHFAPVAYGGRRGARLRLEGALARASVARAARTVTPTRSMAGLVARRTGRAATPLLFGPALAERSEPGGERFAFVHRTTWGPHKNLAVLLEATRLLATTHGGRFVVRSSCDPAGAFARTFASSARERALLAVPQVRAHVEIAGFALGSEAHRTVHGDAVVMPSSVESFCFPLAEATALGLPVAAADADFARELCGDAAFYCPPGDATALSRAMARLVDGERPPPADAQTVARISWARHVDDLAALCEDVAQGAPERPTAAV
jgi:glycosyltransferase involved in cell wall biosynthesis